MNSLKFQDKKEHIKVNSVSILINYLKRKLGKQILKKQKIFINKATKEINYLHTENYKMQSVDERRWKQMER